MNGDQIHSSLGWAARLLFGPGGDWRAQTRIRLCYLWRHGRIPRLDRPTRFTEHVQLRKLAPVNPALIATADKLASKALVAGKLGHEWTVPTLWSGDTLPPACDWPLPLVIKSRHGCNQRLFARNDGEMSWDSARCAAIRWTRRPYGLWLDETIYRCVPRGILVEPFIGEAGVLPVDYKFYVFGGAVTHIQVHVNRETRHRWFLFDRAFEPLLPAAAEMPRPRSLTAMIAAAETLGAGFDFIRVDMYEIDGKPVFGEFSAYPGSGLDPFHPPEVDEAMGQLWAAAYACR